MKEFLRPIYLLKNTRYVFEMLKFILFFNLNFM